MNKSSNAYRRAIEADFDLRPAQIYAEAASYLQQQKLLALQTAMQSLFWKPPRRRN
ncbi:MAG: hypothetical protein ABWZ40_10225 [Caulobacterales bacterium]